MSRRRESCGIAKPPSVIYRLWKSLEACPHCCLTFSLGMKFLHWISSILHSWSLSPWWWLEFLKLCKLLNISILFWLMHTSMLCWWFLVNIFLALTVRPSPVVQSLIEVIRFLGSGCFLPVLQCCLWSWCLLDDCFWTRNALILCGKQ